MPKPLENYDGDPCEDPHEVLKGARPTLPSLLPPSLGFRCKLTGKLCGRVELCKEKSYTSRPGKAIHWEGKILAWECVVKSWMKGNIQD